MLHMKFLILSFTAFLALVFIDSGSIPYTCNRHSSCGEIVDITYPFRLEGDPISCGEPKYELSCINNQTIVSLEEGNFAVKAINYTNSIIRVSDLGVEEGNCSSIPQYSLPRYVSPYLIANSSNIESIAYLSCEKPLNSHFYVDTSDCIRKNEAFGRRYNYVVVAKSLNFSELATSCAIDLVTTTTLLRDTKKNFTYLDIHKQLVYGLELSFGDVQCDHCPILGFCRLYNNIIYFNCYDYTTHYKNGELYISDFFPYTCNHHSSCGEIIDITYPFRLKGDPKSCGEPKYELSCINNQTILNLKEGNFAVKSIDYYSSIIRVSDLGVEEGNYCSSIPRYSISLHGINDYSPYLAANSSNIESIAYLSCEEPVNSHFYMNTSNCIRKKGVLGRRYSYVVVDKSLDMSELAPSCAVDLVTAVTLLRDTKNNFTYADIHKELVYGLELSFNHVQCDHCNANIGESVSRFCRLYNNTIYFNCYYDYNPLSYSSNIVSYTCNHHSSCGDIVNITYPFRLKGDPKSCREPRYELSCINNQTILNLRQGIFAVKGINYTNSIIRVMDLEVQESNYSSIPRYSFSSDSYDADYDSSHPYERYLVQQGYQTRNSKYFERFAYVTCDKPMSSPFYVNLNTSNCISALGRGGYCYVMVDRMELRELASFSCVVDLVTTTATDSMKNFTYVDIHKDLVYGFELGFHRVQCEACISSDPWAHFCYCSLRNNTLRRWYREYDHSYCIFYIVDAYVRYHFQSVSFLLPMAPYITPYVTCSGLLITKYFMLVALNLLVLIFASRMLCGCPCFLVFLIYKWRRRHLSMDDSLEQFLQDQNDLMPIRYSYSQIKKMCRGFQEKLGEGGFGCVFKGNLKSRQFVAIKMLNNPKANAQDFINEVATIGRIHHVNVICLVGFCAERQKRALVYEFMHKGSLDKYICSRQGCISLGWKKLYEISLGIARGIEYLHRGCDMQILHFDIKPHNVLLDENFIPKISDFGLAKSYPTGNSIVSLTGARGTIGYIAPELIYKRIGGVSSKADVYSFGMLLMEMAGKKKKQNKIASSTNGSSKMYFPMWVYQEIIGGKRDREINEVEKISRKMIVVALWCIQIRPCNRPLMRKVIEMLEGEVENLELPPEPTFNIEEVPEEVSGENVEESINPAWSSFTLIAGTSESVALMVSAK